jgi:hypothetical protein
VDGRELIGRRLDDRFVHLRHRGPGDGVDIVQLVVEGPEEVGVRAEILDRTAELTDGNPEREVPATEDRPDDHDTDGGTSGTEGWPRELPRERALFGDDVAERDELLRDAFEVGFERFGDLRCVRVRGRIGELSVRRGRREHGDGYRSREDESEYASATAWIPIHSSHCRAERAS